MKTIRFFWLSFGALLLGTFILLYGIICFKNANLQQAYEAHIDNGELNFLWHQQSSSDEKERILKLTSQSQELQQALQENNKSLQHLALMRWVMDQVPKVAPNTGSTPYEMLQASHSGKGLVCSGMATLLAEVVTLHGGKARVLGLSSGFGERYNTHTVAEIWEEGGWKLYDPTFNLTFTNTEGQKLSVMEIRSLLRHGKKVHFVFHGEVLYPARVENYYISYNQLVDYVFASTTPPSFIEKIPPLRYFCVSPVPVLFTNITNAERAMDSFRFHNELYKLFFLFIPSILIVLTVCVIASGIAIMRNNSTKHKQN